MDLEGFLSVTYDRCFTTTYVPQITTAQASIRVNHFFVASDSKVFLPPYRKEAFVLFETNILL